jgi:hypothetical protein
MAVTRSPCAQHDVQAFFVRFRHACRKHTNEAAERLANIDARCEDLDVLETRQTHPGIRVWMRASPFTDPGWEITAASTTETSYPDHFSGDISSGRPYPFGSRSWCVRPSRP